MNKHDLIAAVAASTNLSKTDAAGAIEAVLTVITKSLKKREKVLLVGFGTFTVAIGECFNDLFVLTQRLSDAALHIDQRAIARTIHFFYVLNDIAQHLVAAQLAYP